jgi:hypothetical protein
METKNTEQWARICTYQHCKNIAMFYSSYCPVHKKLIDNKKNENNTPNKDV